LLEIQVLPNATMLCKSHVFKNQKNIIFNLITAIVLMHRALPVMDFEPLPDAAEVEPTKALQAAHFLPHFEFFQADGAFSVVDAVLLGCLVRENAGSSNRDGGLRMA
jgi:hypothetical protein